MKYSNLYENNTWTGYINIKGKYSLFKKIINEEINDTKENKLKITSNWILDNIEDDRDGILTISKSFIIIAAVMIVLSIIIIFKNIEANIYYHKKEIGILESLGYSKIDIFRVFNIYNLLIFIITAIICLPLSFVFLGLFNKFYFCYLNKGIKNIPYYKVSLYSNYNWIILVVICFIVPIISTIVPIVCSSKKSITENLSSD